MITIDGSFGEGGGQIIRSSLALSMVTGKPVQIENIRAGRARPGLLRQHLTALQAATEICDATVTGGAIGSQQLTFEPGEVRNGEHQYKIGSAGSTTLVLQTVLPALLVASATNAGTTRITIEGGTHNTYSPPYDFLKKSFLPLLERMGPKVQLTLNRYGFYPAGGGSITAEIRPATALGPLVLVERGEMLAKQVRALVGNLPYDIAKRECQTIQEATDWDDACFNAETVKNVSGPGNVVMIELDFENCSEVFTMFGEKRVAAENVAKKAYKAANFYLHRGQPVGEYLADQLLLPLAIGAWRGTGGGRFATGPLTSHTKTHIELIRQFLDVQIVEEKLPESCRMLIIERQG